MKRLPLFAIVILFAPAGSTAAADISVSDATSLTRAVTAARPGDRILIEPGTYKRNFYFRNVHGTANNPIVIAAANPKKPPTLVGIVLCLQFSGASYLELRDLELSGASGNGLVIDDADQFERPATNITLKNIHVRDIGPKVNCDGIKLSGLDEFRIENCTVNRWGSDGSGIDMVGCHRGIITGCTFQNGGSNALQMKGGSSDMTVRGCKFDSYGERGLNIGGSTGNSLFRPPLKSMPADRKYEAKNIRVEGCTFIGGEAPVAFVGVDGAVFRFNTIYKPERYALRILQEKTDAGFVPCRDGLFQDNIIVFPSSWRENGVNIGPNTAPQTFRFARNVWYCLDRPDRSAPKLPSPGRDEIVGQDPQFQNVANSDFTLKPGSPATGRGADALPPMK